MNKPSFSQPGRAGHVSGFGFGIVPMPTLGQRVEDEFRRSTSRSLRSPPKFPGAGGPHQRPRPHPRPVPRPGFTRHWPAWYGVETVSVQAGDDRVRWAKDCLNRVMAASLPDTSDIDVATRSVIRGFQRREGMPASGTLDPATIDALRAACDSGASPPTPDASDHEIEAIPETVRRWLPSGDASGYRYCCRLAGSASADEKTLPARPGVYLIVFEPASAKLAGQYQALGFSGKERAYSGMASNLRQRIEEHRRDVMQMGFLPDNHRVFIRLADTPRAREHAVNSALIPTGLVTNRQKEVGGEWNQDVEQRLGAKCPGCGCARCRCAPGSGGPFWARV